MRRTHLEKVLVAILLVAGLLVPSAATALSSTTVKSTVACQLAATSCWRPCKTAIRYWLVRQEAGEQAWLSDTDCRGRWRKRSWALARPR